MMMRCNGVLLWKLGVMPCYFDVLLWELGDMSCYFDVLVPRCVLM
ncbi:hypothetical protein HMPREF2111_01131 [Staphylococcus aureus 917]|nr:hypothetical protein HMPREF9528_00995 [Staphylococcus aureus subsp. aureus MRSA131]EFW35491.1 hypothetical protein HMPREF9529_00871 [Staphylococcus aureus subsp. aureus MRSA177]KAJ46430.1 hypothetical protein HMPREF1625_02323 [Staphylococcus aureus 880]KIE15668.1 hypothetical protein HMPREF2111_01131 [Staphylococcus aureus 917]KXA32697.1 hypothetical protein HMPREF3211_02557 [Staphylococcus aureus]